MPGDTSDMPIRVLHVIGAMDRGGAETFIMNVYRSIDRNVIQFDFLVHEDRECAYDAEIKELGGNIYRLPRFTGLNFFDYRKRCRRFFREHSEYSVVHGHIGSSAAIYLAEAKRAGMFTVAHSHNTNSIGIAHIPFAVMSYPTRYIADVFFACSPEAGVDRFGKRIASRANYRVVNNGIIVDQYRFSEERRTVARIKLGLNESTPVFCHVGRFATQKNHPFLFEVFAHIVSLRPDARLLLVGGGSLEEEYKDKVKNLGIASQVRFLGILDDVASILMASDVFIFPSLWEGLSVAAIEAQATGLPCLLSSNQTHYLSLTDRVVFLPLDDGAEKWACHALKRVNTSTTNRQCQADAVKRAGFDIVDTTKKLSAFYRSHQLW